MGKRSINIDYRKGWSTHLPVLIKLFSITDGPIMEVGSGVYSTPVLHWLCHPTRRKLVSYEDDLEFIKLAKEYQAKYHVVRHVDKYANIPLKEKYSIIFIDHGGNNRGETAVRLKDIADYIVIHDTNAVRGNDFDIIPQAFKYYRDYQLARPWTGIASNFYPLDNLW